MAPGATETATTSLTIPPTTAVGAYYLVAVADVSDAVPEVTETNNMTFRQILIGGDAIVSVFTVTFHWCRRCHDRGLRHHEELRLRLHRGDDHAVLSLDEPVPRCGRHAAR